MKNWQYRTIQQKVTTQYKSQHNKKSEHNKKSQHNSHNITKSHNTTKNYNTITRIGVSAGNSPVSGEFPSQRAVTRSFDGFFDLYLNKRLSKQSRPWWFETPPRSLWRHCNENRTVCMFYGMLCTSFHSGLFPWRFYEWWNHRNKQPCYSHLIIACDSVELFC